MCSTIETHVDGALLMLPKRVGAAVQRLPAVTRVAGLAVGAGVGQRIANDAIRQAAVVRLHPRP